MEVIRVLLAVLCLGVSNSALAAELEITINGVLPGEGELLVALFDSNAGFPVDVDENQVTRSVTPESDSVTLSFEGLVEGTWAVIVLQDLNGNGKLDSNFLGFPKEPYGASNNKLPRLSAPEFDDSSFELSDGLTSIEIDLRLP